MGTRIEVVSNGEAAEGVEVELTAQEFGGYELAVASREGLQIIRIADRDRLVIPRALYGAYDAERSPAEITTDYQGNTILRWGFDFRLDFEPVAPATGAVQAVAFGGLEVRHAA